MSPDYQTPLSLCQLRVTTYIDSTLLHIEHLFSDESRLLRLLSVISVASYDLYRLHTVTKGAFIL